MAPVLAGGTVISAMTWVDTCLLRADRVADPNDAFDAIHYESNVARPKVSNATGIEFRDPLPAGGTGPAMVAIPRGTLRAGCWPRDCPDARMPAREIVFDHPFALSKYEVTVRDYRRFALATGRGIESPQEATRDEAPMVNVSWREAVEYAAWLSSQTSRNYRLPSEAEWEYAAAPGESQAGTQGNGLSFDIVAWPPHMADVGSGQSNRLGLYDLVGNVSEWVSGCGESLPPPAGAAGASSSTLCSVRIRRGSSWIHPEPNPGASLRLTSAGELRALDTGFRLAADLD